MEIHEHWLFWSPRKLVLQSASAPLYPFGLHAFQMMKQRTSDWDTQHEHTRTARGAGCQDRRWPDDRDRKSAWRGRDARGCWRGDGSIWEATRKSGYFYLQTKASGTDTQKQQSSTWPERSGRVGDKAGAWRSYKRKPTAQRRGWEREREREAREHLDFGKTHLSTATSLSRTLWKLSHQSWKTKLCLHPLVSRRRF